MQQRTTAVKRNTRWVLRLAAERYVQPARNPIKKMRKIIITLLVFFLITSCRQKEKVVSINQITTNYETLIQSVKNSGDKDAYDELFYAFKDSNEAGRTDSLMVYSKIMAENFKYEKAYFDYFEALCEKHNVEVYFTSYSKIDLTKMERLARNKANDWLNKMVTEKVITQKQFDSIKK